MRSDSTLAFSEAETSGLGLPGRRFEDGVSQSGNERNHLFVNDSSKAFHDVSGLSGLDSPADGRAFAWFDYDRDGWLDFAVVNANAPLFELYRNEMGDGADESFVVVELVGGNAKPEAAAGVSSRSAIGSRVEVEVGDRTLVRELRAGEGHAAQNSARLVIGVGSADVVDEIRVRWPSGRSAVVADVPTGQKVMFHEQPDGDARVEVSPYVPAPTAARIRAAVRRANGYFGSIERSDPGWRGVFGYLHGRFGHAARLASGAGAHEAASEKDEDPALRAILARMDDPRAATDAEAIASIDSPIDRMTAVALHCDRLALPDNWLTVLESAGAAGGYALTHAALASQWSVENGCVRPEDAAGLQEALGRRLVELIRARARLAATDPAITDVWLEATALLTYIGQGDQVSPAWIAEIVALQRPDGGWPAHPRSSESDPHATAVAVWALLEALHPDRGSSRWLPNVETEL